MGSDYKEIAELLKVIGELNSRYELSKVIGEDYYEPGMMDYPAQYYGRYNEEDGSFDVRFEVKGTRYEGRTENIENICVGDEVVVIRENDNPYNPNNFRFETANGLNVGNMPAEFCNALAPLYDAGSVEFTDSRMSYVEPISRRSRYAKKAVVFVEIKGKLTDL